MGSSIIVISSMRYCLSCVTAIFFPYAFEKIFSEIFKAVLLPTSDAIKISSSLSKNSSLKRSFLASVLLLNKSRAFFTTDLALASFGMSLLESDLSVMFSSSDIALCSGLYISFDFISFFLVGGEFD